MDAPRSPESLAQQFPDYKLNHFDQPAVAYVSRESIDFYSFRNPDGTLVDLEPGVFSVTVHLLVKGGHVPGTPSNPGGFRLSRMKLIHGEAIQSYEIYGPREGAPFLNGKVWYFKWVETTESTSTDADVNRLGVLGLTRPPNSRLGFFRIIDSLGDGFPPLTGGPNDFQYFTSPMHFADIYRLAPANPAAPRPPIPGSVNRKKLYFKDYHFEVGSPARMI